MADEKPTFGASIEPHSPELTQPRLQINSSPFGDEKAPLPTINSASEASTPALTPVASRNDLDMARFDSKNPFSAFYAHPQSRTSLEQLSSSRNASRQNLNPIPGGPSDSTADLEKGLRPQISSVPNLTGVSSRPSQDVLRQQQQQPPPHDCPVWPTKQTLKAKARAMKLERRMQRSERGYCGCCVALREQYRLKGRMKLWVKILIGLLIVAVAVGLGIGISKAVGGGVWANHGSSQIGSN